MKHTLFGILFFIGCSAATAADRGDVAAGIIGGIILGNIIGQYQYHYPPQQYPRPVIINPPVVIQNPCYWTQVPIYDSWNRIIAYRQVRICQNY